MKTISPNQDNIMILMESDYEVSEFVRVFQPVFERDLLGERRRQFAKS